MHTESRNILFESKYKDFLKIREQWMKLLFAHSVYSDTNPTGDKCRPVAILSDKDSLREAKELLAAWTQFASFAEEESNNGTLLIPKSVYSPIPSLISDAKCFTIGSYKATTTKTMVREGILQKIDKKMNILSKRPEKNAYALADLKMDHDIIDAYPLATKFRVRTTGYNDIIIDVSHDITYAAEVRYRVNSYGAAVDATTMETPTSYQINDGTKVPQASHYQLVRPIQCSIFSGSSLYLLSAIEEAQKIHKIIRHKKNHNIESILKKETPEKK